jgi:hypothetical protein
MPLRTMLRTIFKRLKETKGLLHFVPGGGLGKPLGGLKFLLVNPYMSEI